MIAQSSSLLRWPADTLFWSVLDFPAARNLGPLPESLLEEFGEDVPHPVDELFAIASSTACGRTLVCAARRDELARVPSHVVGITPDSIPTCLGVEADRDSLNFMVGVFEPRPVRARRLRLHAMGVGLLVIAGTLLSIGLARRAMHLNEVAHAARARADAMALEALPGQDPVWADRTLDAQLAGLRTRANASELSATPPDAALRLASLLNAWPSNVPSKPQSISVTPAAMMISVALEGDAAEFLRAMKAPEGWTIDEPRMNAASGVTRVSLQLKPTAIAPKEGNP